MKNPINSLKEKITQYAQLRYEQFRLETIERVVNVMGYFAYVIVAIFLFFTAGFFLSLGLAEWLATLFKSKAAGYFSVAGIVLLFSFVFLLKSKYVVNYFAGKMAMLLTRKKKPGRHLTDDDEDDEEEA